MPTANAVMIPTWCNTVNASLRRSKYTASKTLSKSRYPHVIIKETDRSVLELSAATSGVSHAPICHASTTQANPHRLATAAWTWETTCESHSPRPRSDRREYLELDAGIQTRDATHMRADEANDPRQAIATCGGAGNQSNMPIALPNIAVYPRNLCTLLVSTPFAKSKIGKR